MEEEVEATSTSRLDEANQSTNSTNNGNPKPKFDKTKVKCYDYKKMNHYARDCWNLTRRVGENVNHVVENEK